MVYLCRSKVLLIFKHDQTHVMINEDAHIFKGDNSSFILPYNMSITSSHFANMTDYLWHREFIIHSDHEALKHIRI
jgi:hypothetical protein